LSLSHLIPLSLSSSRPFVLSLASSHCLFVSLSLCVFVYSGQANVLKSMEMGFVLSLVMYQSTIVMNKVFTSFIVGKSVSYV